MADSGSIAAMVVPLFRGSDVRQMVLQNWEKWSSHSEQSLQHLPASCTKVHGMLGAVPAFPERWTRHEGDVAQVKIQHSEAREAIIYGDTLHLFLRKEAGRNQAREALCRATILALSDSGKEVRTYDTTSFDSDVDSVLYPMLASE